MLRKINYYYSRSSIEKNIKQILNQVFNSPPQTSATEQRRIIMTTSKVTNYFGNSFLDRQSDRRKDAKWLEEQMRSPKSVYILFHVDRPFMSTNDAKHTIGLSKFTYEQVMPFLTTTDSSSSSKSCNWIFLGVEYEKTGGEAVKELETGSHDDVSLLRSPYSNADNYYNLNLFKSWFAVDTSVYDANAENINKMFDCGKFFDGNFLRLMAVQDVLESSVIAQARSIFCWIDRNKFCATCGQANQLSEGGYKLACLNTSGCKSHSRAANKHIPSNIHYPRVDPVVIMLVISSDHSRVLLGRKKGFPGRMFSCLAGYVEAGESLEEAVRRETYEECGIHCDRVEYHSSQPWPFPSSLMLGCMAYARSEEIRLDMNEIDEARWFTRDEVDAISNGTHPEGVSIPPDRAIANRLITFWLKNMNSSKL